jgi:L-threonylcarbamoyladenylate synthase
MDWNNENFKKVIKNGNIAVMPTDTIYGVVGSAFDSSAVDRIYEIRMRAPEKPCVILIGEIDQLNFFSILLSAEQKERLVEFWSLDSAQGKPPPRL